MAISMTDIAQKKHITKMRLMTRILEFPEYPELYWLDKQLKKAGFSMADIPYRTFDEHRQILQTAKDNIRDIMMIEGIHFSYDR